MYKKVADSISILDEEMDVIIGTMLGDASISRSRNKIESAYMRFYHSYKQDAYCKYKASFLQRHTNKGVYKYAANRNGEEYITSRFDTKFTKEFFNLYSMFYPDGKKIIPDNIADSLSPLALAIWYQDDGSLEGVNEYDKRRDSYSFRHKICLHTNSFSKSDQEKLQEILWKKFEIKFYLKKVDYGKHYIMYIRNRKDIEKFVKIVSRYIHPTMKYKIKLRYPSRAKRKYNKDKIKTICQKLDIKQPKDCNKYRNGEKICNAVCWHWGSFKKMFQ